jgi:hypothetical protein
MYDGQTLPHGVASELESAVLRTGWTAALMHAAELLPIIFAMTPKQFEMYSKPFYQSMP